MSPPLVYVIAGEPSGDALGAAFMRSLASMEPEITFAGIGGDAMQSEGLTSLFPYRELSIMGFLEVLPHIPKILRRIRQTADDIAAKQPVAIVTIDSPGFCFRLAKLVQNTSKTAHIKRIHYVAPSVWAYKPQRAAKTARLYDELLTLLPFEPPYFEQEGLKAVFVGHPTLWQNWNGDAQAFRNRHKIPPEKQVLLILPGSRPGEIKKHLNLFLESAKALPDYQPVILAGSLVREIIQARVPKGTHVVDISEKNDAFAAATLALSKSGTVTLELAAAGVPMVVAYKVNPLSAWLLRRMILIQYASLVNIAVQKEIVPEYLQERCTLGNLQNGLLALSGKEAQNAQRKACLEALTMLRGTNTIPPDRMAAQTVLEGLRLLK